jgi:hypothetical protein
MKLNKIKVIREWISAWKAIWANSWYLPASAALDLVFLTLYGFMTAPFFASLTEHVMVIGTLLSEQMREVAGRARPAIIDALFQPPVSRYTWQFFGLLVILAVAVFLIYCVFQGIAWHIAGKVSGSKAHWRQYLLGFARINLLWGALYFLWQCISTMVELRRIAIEKMTNLPAPESGIFMSVLLVVLVYFALASYPILSIKKAFSAGIHRISVLVPAMLIAGAQLYAGDFLVRRLTAVNVKLAFIVSVIVFLVLLAFTRAYVTFVVRRAD